MMTAFAKKNHYEGSRTNFERASYLGIIRPKSIKFSLNISEEYPDHYSVIEEIALERERETSWLYTEERYAYIRKLALADKIAVITESILASDVFNSMRCLLAENFIQIDTLYVSNIAEWMFHKEQKESFIATINYLLMDDETILLDAKKINIHEHEAPSQRYTSKKQLPKNSSLEQWFFSATAPKEEKLINAVRVNQMPQFAV